jgi:hypothetical protein
MDCTSETERQLSKWEAGKSSLWLIVRAPYIKLDGVCTITELTDNSVTFTFGLRNMAKGSLKLSLQNLKDKSFANTADASFNDPFRNDYDPFARWLHFVYQIPQSECFIGEFKPETVPR